MFYNFARFVVRIWLRLWFKVILVGNTHPPTNKGYILASNHISAMDPMFIGVMIEPDVNYMGKAELFHNPFVAMVMRGIHVFAVERGKGDTTAIDHAQKIILERHVMAIFPEGTRSKTGELLRGRSGAALVAHQTQADIMCAGIWYEDREKRHFRSRVVVSYGEIVPFERFGIVEGKASELRTATKQIMENIAEQLENAKKICNRERT